MIVGLGTDICPPSRWRHLVNRFGAEKAAGRILHPEELAYLLAGNRERLPERLAGRLKARLQFADVDELEAVGAGPLLTTVVNECARIHEAIYETFVAYPLETRLPA